jgi:hypothetical protein
MEITLNTIIVSQIVESSHTQYSDVTLAIGISNHIDRKFRTIWLRCFIEKHQLRLAGGQIPGVRKVGRGLGARRAYHYDLITTS